ncbi:hypothetical protein [Sulfurovum sp.]|jgi:hypothetical protein|uniref:hypothetical protein n=1 Tax=Sulfurovum sp. TaxID=1969726 RepID=UPI0025D82C62|nr:hypothetical protein [Sulfurovum sp.]
MGKVFIYAVGWLGLVLLAIGNGALREKTYGIHVSELLAHQLSTLTGLVLFGIYIYFFTGIFRLESAKQALLIGLMWVIMTIVFEFVFGHYVMGHSWQRLLDDYNLLKGRVWIFILIATLFYPYLFFKIRS